MSLIVIALAAASFATVVACGSSEDAEEETDDDDDTADDIIVDEDGPVGFDATCEDTEEDVCDAAVTCPSYFHYETVEACTDTYEEGCAGNVNSYIICSCECRATVSDEDGDCEDFLDCTNDCYTTHCLVV
ncbi:MAG: hypothetical protein H6685_09375 [Deltaproteobacteria bacterium]|nr:hypothetical protein [Deltaproteobacteria bacterium]